MSTNMRKWSKEEIELLQDLWELNTISHLCKLLKRTQSSIEHKAHRLKLGSRNAMYFTINQLFELTGFDTKTIANWVHNYGLKCKKKKCKVHYRYYIDIEIFIKWLEDNQDKWSSKNLPILALGVEPLWLQTKRERDKKPLLAKKGTSWSKKEIEILIKLKKQKEPNHKIAQVLNRSEGSVSKYIYKLRKQGKL